MKMLRHIVLSVFLILIHCSRGFQYRYFSNAPLESILWGVDHRRSGHSPVDISLPLELKWEFRPSGGLGRSINAVDSLIYFGTKDGYIHFLHCRTGKKLRSYKIKKKSSVSCAVQDTLMAVVLRKDKPSLRMIDLLRNKTKWSHHIGDVEGEPLIYENVVYTGNVNGHIYAVHLTNGRILWERRLNIPLYSSFALKDNWMVISADDGRIFCLDRITGEQIWKTELASLVPATPVIGDSAVFIGTAQSACFALSIKDGALLWKFECDGNVFETGGFADNHFYFGTTQGSFFCLRADDGYMVWNHKMNDSIGTSPFIGTNHVVFCTLNKQIVILNRFRGDEVWRFELKNRIRTTPIIWKTVLITASEDRRIYGFSHPN